MEWPLLHVGHYVANSPLAMVGVMVGGGALGLGIAFLPQILARIKGRPLIDRGDDGE